MAATLRGFLSHATARTLTAAAATLPFSNSVTDIDVTYEEDTGDHFDDQEEFKKVHPQKKRKNVRKNLYDRIEVFTAKPVSPEHVWNLACKLYKCTLCMEEGGQTFVEKCQPEGFKAHLRRIPHAVGKYHYEVDYIVDPQADLLPDNYMASYQSTTE